jgi:metal-responsive CopG/Arc/MetJ family transcriptional regulator
MGTDQRKGRRRSYEHLTISLPAELVEEARGAMRHRGLTSFSAYAAETIRENLRSRKFEDLLDAMFAEQPITDDEKAWAERALYR